MNVHNFWPGFSAVRLHFKAIALNANAQTKEECLPRGLFSQATLSFSLFPVHLELNVNLWVFSHYFTFFFFRSLGVDLNDKSRALLLRLKAQESAQCHTFSPPRSPFLSNTYVNTSSYSSASRTRHMKQSEGDFFFFHSNLLFTKGNRTALSGQMEIISSFYAMLQVSVKHGTKKEQVQTRRGVNAFLCVCTFENHLWE